MYSHRTDDPHNIVGHPRFPRSSTYDPDWVFDGHMVENPLWLLERLCEILEIPSGAQVLDRTSRRIWHVFSR